MVVLMLNYSRPAQAGASVFFTLRLRAGRRVNLTDHVAALRGALAEVASDRPFRQVAMVILTDHLHAVWTMPPRDRAWGLRWCLVQARMGSTIGQRGALWQRQVEQTVLETQASIDWHVDYCIYDPVKHGLVTRPQDWPHIALHHTAALSRIERERPDLIA